MNGHDSTSPISKGDSITKEFFEKQISQLYEGLQHQAFLYNPGNFTEAEDLVQEVLFKAWKNLDQYDSDKGKFSTWIFRIMKNLHIDRLRNALTLANDDGHMKSRFVPVVEVYENSEEEVSNNHLDQISFSEYEDLFIEKEQKDILRRILYQGIDSLRQEEQNVILARLGGFSYMEIAKRLNVPDGTVKARLYNAKLNLQTYFYRKLKYNLSFNLKPTTMAGQIYADVEVSEETRIAKRIIQEREAMRSRFWKKIRGKVSKKMQSVIAKQHMYNIPAVSKSTKFISVNAYNFGQAGTVHEAMNNLFEDQDVLVIRGGEVSNDTRFTESTENKTTVYIWAPYTEPTDEEVKKYLNISDSQSNGVSKAQKGEGDIKGAVSKKQSALPKTTSLANLMPLRTKEIKFNLPMSLSDQVREQNIDRLNEERMPVYRRIKTFFTETEKVLLQACDDTQISNNAFACIIMVNIDNSALRATKDSVLAYLRTEKYDYDLHMMSDGKCLIYIFAKSVTIKSATASENTAPGTVKADVTLETNKNIVEPKEKNITMVIDLKNYTNYQQVRAAIQTFCQEHEIRPKSFVSASLNFSSNEAAVEAARVLKEAGLTTAVAKGGKGQSVVLLEVKEKFFSGVSENNEPKRGREPRKDVQAKVPGIDEKPKSIGGASEVSEKKVETAGATSPQIAATDNGMQLLVTITNTQMQAAAEKLSNETLLQILQARGVEVDGSTAIAKVMQENGLVIVRKADPVAGFSMKEGVTTYDLKTLTLEKVKSFVK